MIFETKININIVLRVAKISWSLEKLSMVKFYRSLYFEFDSGIYSSGSFLTVKSFAYLLQ